MVDTCRIAAGWISGLIRASLAMYLIIMDGFAPTLPIVIVCGLAGLFMASSIHSVKSTSAIAIGRKLSGKESRGCCARAYIWVQLIVMNVCLLLTPLFMKGLHARLLTTYIATVVVCLILDIYCVSCANFKFFCGSYRDC